MAPPPLPLTLPGMVHQGEKLRLGDLAARLSATEGVRPLLTPRAEHNTVFNTGQEMQDYEYNPYERPVAIEMR